MLEDVLIEAGGHEVDAMTVYSDIFRLGEGCIQSENVDKKNLKANPIAYWKNDKDLKGHYRILFEDTFEDILKECQDADFSIINGLTYFGRKNLQANASKMYAMIFDLDGQTDKTLLNFINYARFWERFPIPNYIALSGHGIHVYYVFDEPINLYPNTKMQLKALKYALTDIMWNSDTSTIDKPQHQGINQGFRPIGGKTKLGDTRVRVFALNEHPVTLEELNEAVEPEERVDLSKVWKESKYTLEDAKKLYPDWYEKRILQNDSSKGHWTCKADLYEWWKREIKKGASLHHRYFCIMCLAIYGIKSGIDEETVRADAMSFLPMMNMWSEPFTESDIDSALECYDERYFTFPRDDISKLSAIEIKANTRNHRTQADHIKRITLLRDLDYPDGSWRNKEGRKPMQDVVKEWRRNHPEGRKIDCINDTKLSKTTVYKWWDK